MDEKRLEQEYRQLKHQAAPDLWDRIEGGLKEHPERERGKKADRKPEKTVFRRRQAYGMAAAAAAMVVLAVSVMGRRVSVLEGRETEYAAEAAGEGRDIAEGAFADAEPTESRVESGQVQLMEYTLLEVPGQAVTVAEDTRYFSEGILSDTELLLGGVVTDSFLEEDDSGRAVKAVYEMTVDQVYYAEDYTTGMDTITVKSPIVETEGDMAYVLYQLKQGETYLLPLRKQQEDWELLFPFAPQIQAAEGGYLFHTGYVSLVNEAASVVTGSPEGVNDFYYDRMVLRQDDNFLFDFVSLVKSQVQGRRKE